MNFVNSNLSFNVSKDLTIKEVNMKLQKRRWMIKIIIIFLGLRIREMTLNFKLNPNITHLTLFHDNFCLCYYFLFFLDFLLFRFFGFFSFFLFFGLI